MQVLSVYFLSSPRMLWLYIGYEQVERQSDTLSQENAKLRSSQATNIPTGAQAEGLDKKVKVRIP